MICVQIESNLKWAPGWFSFGITKDNMQPETGWGKGEGHGSTLILGGRRKEGELVLWLVRKPQSFRFCQWGRIFLLWSIASPPGPQGGMMPLTPNWSLGVVPEFEEGRFCWGTLGLTAVPWAHLEKGFPRSPDILLQVAMNPLHAVLKMWSPNQQHGGCQTFLWRGRECTF